jgi:hypothetical protein
MNRALYTLILVCITTCAFSARAGAQSSSANETAPPAAGEGAAPPRDGAEPLDFTGDVAATSHTPLTPPPPRTEGAAASPAREASPAALPVRRPNALNLSVLGFVIGAVRLTYERMILPKHGVFGEAIVAPDILRGFEFVGFGGAVGYRFHWRGAETSAFVGGTLSLTRASGTTPTFKLGDRDFPEFRGSVWTIGIAPHVGKRWLFERSGVNLTLRVGGGLGYHVVDAWRGSEPGARRNLQRSFLVTDGELSVGYSF